MRSITPDLATDIVRRAPVARRKAAFHGAPVTDAEAMLRRGRVGRREASLEPTMRSANVMRLAFFQRRFHFVGNVEARAHFVHLRPRAPPR